MYASGTTTVTVQGGTDYTLVSAAISANYHSYEMSPQGWPGWFNFNAAVGGWAGTPTVFAKFHVSGKVCHIMFYADGSGANASNSSSANAQAPFLISDTNEFVGLIAYAIDNSTGITIPGLISQSSGGAQLDFFHTMTGGGWTPSGWKRVLCNFFYPI